MSVLHLRNCSRLPRQARLFLTWITIVIVPADNMAQAQMTKPNIVVIWGDDLGLWNLGAYIQSYED